MDIDVLLKRHIRKGLKLNYNNNINNNNNNNKKVAYNST